MAGWFTYYLVLISVGAPAGLAIYHYFINPPNGELQQKKDCCCNKDQQTNCQTDCSDSCPSN